MFEEAFESSTDAMLVLHCGAPTHANAVARAVFVETPWFNAVEAISRPALLSAVAAWGSGSAHDPVVVWTAAEPSRVFEFRGVTVGTGAVLLIGRDVTAVHELTTKLQASLEADEQLAYAASHDLQEPLRTVTNYAGFLLEDFGDVLPEEAKEQLGYVIDAAKHGRLMVQGLLQISRVGKVQPADISLKSVVERAVLNLEFSIRSAGATVQHGALPVVYGDFHACVTLLQNIVANAIKFVEVGVAPAVNVSARRVHDEWEISVEDNGIGIDPVHSSKVFEMFRRLDKTRPGTGVGLATCKKIVEAHGGRIWVEALASGTAVRFTLPAVSNEAHPTHRGQSSGRQGGDTVSLFNADALPGSSSGGWDRGTFVLASAGELRDRPAPRSNPYGFGPARDLWVRPHWAHQG